MNTSADLSPAEIHVLPESAALPIQPRKSLLELCLAHRIPLTHACGGMARCSTCRVVVLQGSEHCAARNAAEQDLAHRLGFDTHVRLACQTHISGPAQIRRLVLDERDEDFAGSTGSSGKIAALGEEITAATPPRLRTMPPRYACSRSRHAGAMHGRRSFVLKTMW